jgi:Tfp pilus assembly protein PilP
MAKVTLSVSIEESRLDALTYFMAKERRTPQKELEQTLQKLYEECVPSDTREYIERKTQTPPARPRRSTPSRPTPAPIRPDGGADGSGQNG